MKKNGVIGRVKYLGKDLRKQVKESIKSITQAYCEESNHETKIGKINAYGAF